MKNINDYASISLLLNHKAAFACLVECGGIPRASKLTGISSSTYHRRIKALEAYTGVKLVERIRRPLKLTHYGMAYYHCCSAMLEHAKAANNVFE